jgi:hypothetical protein
MEVPSGAIDTEQRFGPSQFQFIFPMSSDIEPLAKTVAQGERF